MLTVNTNLLRWHMKRRKSTRYQKYRKESNTQEGVMLSGLVEQSRWRSNGTNVLSELVDLLPAKDRICLNGAETQLQLALREKEESAGIVPSQQEHESVGERRTYQVQQVEYDGIA
jgi:hypothetical protein